MQSKTTKLVIVSVVMIFVVVALPVWPVRLASDVWTEEEFLERKSEFENISRAYSEDYYNQIVDDQSRLLEGVTDEDFEKLHEIYRYQINVRYGSVSGRRSLIFGDLHKTQEITTYAFASHVKGGLPYLEYEDEGWRVYLTPSNFNKIAEQVVVE